MAEKFDEALKPADLGPRGSALWSALSVKADPAGAVLVAEACRIADRLERLDALLIGRDEEWARVRLPRGDGEDLVLQVDGALVEARQQAQVLRQLLQQLEVGSAHAGDGKVEGSSFVDELRARRAERVADTSAG